MTRLIDADRIEYVPSVPDAVISRIVNVGREEDVKGLVHVSRAYIEALPTVDAEPVRHGKWIRISSAKIYECSECGQNVCTGDIECYRFCHQCGARMDEDD